MPRRTRRNPSSALPPTAASVASWLKARTKRRKGAFDPKMTAAAFERLGGGWSITPTTALIPVTGTVSGQLEYFQRAAGVTRTDVVAMQSWEAPEQWAISLKAADLLSIVVAVQVDRKGRPVVDRPTPGTLYVTAKPRPGPWGKGPMVLWVQSPSMGVEAWRIHAPDGSSTVVPSPPRHKGDPIKSAAFWKWAYAHGLHEAAKVAAAPSEEEARKAERTAALTKGRGTCAVCFGLYAKHSRGAVVQHGYKMAGGSGWGSGHQGMYKVGGDCFGVGYPSFEKSPKATRLYAEALRDHAAYLQRLVSAWREAADGQPQSGFMSLTFRANHRGERATDVDGRSGRRGEKTVEVTPDHPEWPQLARAKADRIEAEAQSAAQEAVRYDSIAAAWPAYPPR